MDALLKYPLESEGKKFGSCVISMMEHGSWEMQIEIDFSSLPEHDDFQKTTGKIDNRPEVIAICQVVNNFFSIYYATFINNVYLYHLIRYGRRFFMVMKEEQPYIVVDQQHGPVKLV